MSVTNIRPLRGGEPLEQRQACLDVLEWSLVLMLLEHSDTSASETVAEIAAKLRRQLTAPSVSRHPSNRERR